MGRSKASKRKTKEMVVGSDVDDVDHEEPAPSTADDGDAAPVAAAAAETAPESADEAPSSQKQKKKGGPLPKKAQLAAKAKAAVATAPGGSGTGEGAANADNSGDEDDDTESSEEDEEASRRPRIVTYCPVCTFQPEMCEYSGMFEKCKPWLMEHMKEEEAKQLAEQGEKGRRRKGVYAEGEGPVPGAKLKRKPDQCVLVQVKRRSGKKVVTLIQGLDFYGINLKDVTREFKKRFCCGCGIIETAGELDAVEVQGDITVQLADLLPGKYNVPAAEIFKKEGSQKSLLCPPA